MEPELAIKLAKRGGRIFEVPISYSGRTYAEGKKINWKDGVRALWAILRFAASDQIYAADGHGGEILLRLNRAPRFTRWMADVIRPYVGNRVLEIGAGIGNLTVNLVPRAIYWATDVNLEYLGTLERLRANRPYLARRISGRRRCQLVSHRAIVRYRNLPQRPGASRRRSRCVAQRPRFPRRRRRGSGAGSQRPGTFRHSRRSARALPPLHGTTARRSRTRRGIQSGPGA